MPTISFVSSKGGVGKTTSALLLALGLAELGEAVSLVDSDPNLPLAAWASLGGKPDGISLFHAPNFADLPGELRRAKAAAPWVIVDTEGGAPRMGALAVANADLVITPLAASPLEAREAFKAAKLVAQTAGREGRAIPLVCLFARTPAGFRRSFQDIRAQLQAEGLALLDTVLTDKEAFRALFARGGGLDSLNRRQVSGVPAAIALMTQYADEVRALFAG
jgi:chromosome partitioning protein